MSQFPSMAGGAVQEPQQAPGQPSAPSVPSTPPPSQPSQVTSQPSPQGFAPTGSPTSPAGALQTGSQAPQSLAQQPGQPAQTPQWFAPLVEKGLIDPQQHQDESSLLNWVAQQIETSRYLPQYQQYALLGQRVAPHLDRFEQWLAENGQNQPGQAAPVAQSAPAEAEKEWWDREPEWEDDWMGMLTVDESPGSPSFGQVVAKNPAFASLVPKYHQHKQWQERAIKRLIANPVEAIKPGLTPVLEAWAKEQGFVSRKELDEEKRRQLANAIVSDNSTWMYQRDPMGRVLSDQQSGQPVLTPEGMAFAQAAQFLQNADLSDPAMLSQIAMTMLPGLMTQNMPSQQQAAPQVPQSPPQSPQQMQPSPRQAANERFLQGAPVSQHQPNRAGSVIAAGPDGRGVPQNLRASWAQLLEQNARNAGLIT